MIIVSKRIADSIVGDVIGLQKLKTRIHRMKDKKIFIYLDKGVILIFFIVIAYIFDGRSMKEAFFRGICVGLVGGFYIAISPDQSKERSKQGNDE
jgi:hypothetical protein